MSAALLELPLVARNHAAPSDRSEDLTIDDCFRLSLDQFNQLIEAGIVGPDDRCELLDGVMVGKMSQHPPHGSTLTELADALRQLVAPAWRVREQLDVVLPDVATRPEPDVAVVRRRDHKYFKRHPEPADIGLLIEIAESSLRLDRKVKRRLYAGADIPEYWIVNLIERQVEVHRRPIPAEGRYAEIEIVPFDGRLSVVLDGVDFGTLSVAELLP